MSEYPEPVWAELSATSDSAVLRPGDTLIIRLNPEFSCRPTVESIFEQAQTGLPDVRVVVVCADGFAIYRPDPPNPKADS